MGTSRALQSVSKQVLNCKNKIVFIASGIYSLQIPCLILQDNVLQYFEFLLKILIRGIEFWLDFEPKVQIVAPLGSCAPTELGSVMAPSGQSPVLRALLSLKST